MYHIPARDAQTLSNVYVCPLRCQNELEGFFGSAKQDEDIMSRKEEATERQLLCASVRQAERVALQVRISNDRL